MLFNGAAIPGWVTYSYTSNSVQTFDVAPTDGTAEGTWAITVIYESDHGTKPSYTTYTLTVTCTVLSITPPAAPVSGLTYTVYDETLTFDFTASVYTQVPDCMWPVANSYSWEGTSGSPFVTTNAILDVFTQAVDEAGSFEVKLANEITIASNGPAGSTTFTPASDAEKTVFTIDIVDPCVTATINQIAFSTASPSVMDGQTTTVTFIDPTNSVMDGKSTASLLCETVTHEIFLDNDGNDSPPTSTWVVLSGPVAGTYTITFDPKQDQTLIAGEASVTHTVYVKTTLD